MLSCMIKEANAEKTDRIKIHQLSPISKHNKIHNAEYELKENIFDPSKSSPPNNFMKKLEHRMSIYNKKGCNVNIE